jgi:hypothetical protein
VLLLLTPSFCFFSIPPLVHSLSDSRSAAPRGAHQLFLSSALTSLSRVPSARLFFPVRSFISSSSVPHFRMVLLASLLGADCEIEAPPEVVHVARGRRDLASDLHPVCRSALDAICASVWNGGRSCFSARITHCSSDEQVVSRVVVRRAAARAAVFACVVEHSARALRRCLHRANV